MSSGTSGKSKSSTEMGEIVAGASPEAKRALGEILKLERDHLPEKKPPVSEIVRGIAEIVRRVTP
jgi:hypothetical protein